MSVLISRAAALRAAMIPSGFSLRMSRTCGNRSRTISDVPSLDPSSTTTNSSGADCASTDSMARASTCLRSLVVMRTVAALPL